MKDLFSLVASVKGAKFAGIKYVSDCKFPKCSGLGNVTKVVTSTVQLNYEYLKVVLARIAREGGNPATFTQEPLPWGVWELPNKVITNKGKRYLRYYGIEGGTKSVTYFVDGVQATDAQVSAIKAYLATKDTKSAKQTASGLTDKQVVPRCVEFSNILSLSVDGETYEKVVTKQAV